MEPSNEPITVNAALTWYVSEFLVGKKRDRTIEEYHNDLRHVFSAISIKRVVDLSLSFIDHYVAAHTPLLSPATLRRRLSAPSSFLSALCSRDLIPYNIMDRFERPELDNRLPRYLSADQVHVLRSVCAAEPRVFAVIDFLLETGLRAGELVQLRLEDINLESGGM